RRGAAAGVDVVAVAGGGPGAGRREPGQPATSAAELMTRRVRAGWRAGLPDSGISAGACRRA
ncbi:MAG TPA: hypothetical protein VKH19_13775, partial [Gemmatimonadaceae bacterium]|nr:hypothetical protein [Gemmatimonadaceae bacterium]